MSARIAKIKEESCSPPVLFLGAFTVCRTPLAGVVYTFGVTLTVIPNAKNEFLDRKQRKSTSTTPWCIYSCIRSILGDTYCEYHSGKRQKRKSSRIEGNNYLPLLENQCGAKMEVKLTRLKRNEKHSGVLFRIRSCYIELFAIKK